MLKERNNDILELREIISKLNLTLNQVGSEQEVHSTKLKQERTAVEQLSRQHQETNTVLTKLKLFIGYDELNDLGQRSLV